MTPPRPQPSPTGRPRPDPAGPAPPGPVPARPAPPHPAPAGTSPVPAEPGDTPVIRVEDHLAARIRIPADLLRCVIACIEIALLAGLGLLARATATGVEVDVVGASRRLPGPLLGVAGFVAETALLVLPVALAVRLVVRRQPRRLAEAALTGGIAVAVVTGANLLLVHPVAAQMYGALARATTGGRHVPPLDGYLAGLAAYVTVIGLSGRPRWRTAFGLAIGFYGLASLANMRTTVLSLLITLLLGRAIGAGLRWGFGSASERPSAEAIAEALASADAPVTHIRRIWDESQETRRYAAITRDGGQLDVIVFDRDQQAADAIYRLYRRARLKSQVSRIAPLTVQRAVERRALLTYAVQNAGVLTPRLRAVVRVGPETAALANEHHCGSTLAHRRAELTDGELERVWDSVLRLHGRRITHRALTADRILLVGTASGSNAPVGTASGGTAANAGDDSRAACEICHVAAVAGESGDVMLLEPGNGDVAASDLQLRLDVAQLLAELALLVGPERAADSALARISAIELVAVVPLLQPVALYRSTRTAVRRQKEVLPALRRRLLAATADHEVAPAHLDRIRPRSLVTLIATVVAVYLLVGQLDRVRLGGVLRHADLRWTAVALVLSAVSYLGAAWSLTGFVLARLNFRRTFLAQLAASFVTLVTPAAVGGVALNLRYLRRAEVAPADAAASVGVSQLIALTLHTILLVVFVALTGTSRDHSLRPPSWVYLAIAAAAAGVLIVLAFPRGRRLLRSRLAPTLGRVIPRLLDIGQHPAKLAEGIGGALLVTAAYILCLAASVRALGGSVQLASIAVVYLTGMVLGSVVPTPGGLGAVEAALSAGLTAAGLPGITAVSAVLLFRTMTFWLPVPVGWAAMNFLQRHDAL